MRYRDTSDDVFIAGLLARHPELQPLADDNRGDEVWAIFTYPLLADIERRAEQLVLARPAGWEGALASVLGDLEAGLLSGDERVRTLVAVGFVEMLPSPGAPAARLREQLPPGLRDWLVGEEEWRAARAVGKDPG